MAVGDHLRSGLRELAATTGVLGEVRGTGLVAGVDVARDPRSLLEALVARGALAGLTGPGGAVLKIRPPLIWTTAHADLFVDAVAAAVDDVTRDAAST